MTTARILLTAEGDDDSRRRRDPRRTAKALIVLAGLGLLAFASREAPEPALRMAGGVTDFGSHVVGSSSSKDVALRNATDEPFQVAGIVAEGTVIQDFRVDMTRCGNIAPGAECIATVSFAPHAEGSQSAKFRIVDAANASSDPIVMRGAGVPPETTPPPPPPPDVTPSIPEAPPVIIPPPPAPDPEPVPVPAPAPTPVPVKPRPIQPASPAPQPPAPQPPAPQPPIPQPPAPQPAAPKPQPVEIEIPMPPVIEPVPLPDPAPPVATPKPQPEPEPAPTPEVTEPPAQEPTPKPATPDRSRTKDTLKKIGRFAIPLIIGAAIANNNRDHGNRDQGDKQADRRIDVSPRSLTVSAYTGHPERYSTNSVSSVVTVTNIGRDTLTIQSVGFDRNDKNVFALSNKCGQLLAPKQQCQIHVTMNQATSNARATLVVNSNGGRGTVEVASPQEGNFKP